MTLAIICGTLALLVLVREVLKASHRRRPDAAWKPTGYTYTHRGHDEAAGVRAIERAASHEKSRRRLAALRARPEGQAKTIPFPKAGER